MTTSKPTTPHPQHGNPPAAASAFRPTRALHDFRSRENALAYPILVHSHLRWDWVWQRPQQFLSRFARRHPVLFVEEPMAVDGVTSPRAALREVSCVPNLTILRTEFPPAMLRDRAAIDPEQRRLVLATL